MNRARLKWVISGLDFEKLTNWEAGFAEQVEKRFDWREQRTSKGYVTDAEEEILERLYKQKGK